MCVWHSSAVQSTLYELSLTEAMGFKMASEGAMVGACASWGVWFSWRGRRGLDWKGIWMDWIFSRLGAAALLLCSFGTLTSATTGCTP